MTDDRKPNLSDGKPPELVHNMIWIIKNWREHWYVLLLCVFILAAAQMSGISTYIFVSAKEWYYAPRKVGIFNICITNNSDTELRPFNNIEVYITAPGEPGKNRRVGDGVIIINESSNSLVVPPKSDRKFTAEILNEKKILLFVGEGDKFIDFRLGSNQGALKSEGILGYNTFKNCVRFVHEHKT